MRRYLSWIEGLTTNQYVGGSNPSRRTTCASSPHSGLFLSRLMLGSSGFANFFGYELERASMSVKMPPFPSCLKSHPFLTRCFASFQCTCHTGGFIAEKTFHFLVLACSPEARGWFGAVGWTFEAETQAGGVGTKAQDGPHDRRLAMSASMNLKARDS